MANISNVSKGTNITIKVVNVLHAIGILKRHIYVNYKYFGVNKIVTIMYWVKTVNVRSGVGILSNVFYQ
jgi:hypothetical protein